MSSRLTVVVGNDAVAERICAELIAAHERVRVVFLLGTAAVERFERVGAEVSLGDPNSDEALIAAGIRDASAILTLSDHDELNLAVALRARMLNPQVRVILRQFSTKIGRKIEQNLRDATVVSIAVHAAATYAGAALDPGCFFALQFPEASGPLVGFTRVVADDVGVAGLTVAAAEERLGARILTVADASEPLRDTAIHAADRLVVFGPIVERTRAAGGESGGERKRPQPRPLLRVLAARFAALDPIARTIVLVAIAFYAVALLFFHAVLHVNWNAAALDVAEVTTNAGFGDASPARFGPLATAGTMLLMVGGTIFTALFIGFVSAALTRAQWVTLQGLRRVRARGHVVVCGGGRTGGTVVSLLVAAGKRVIVIDTHPDPGLVRRARAGEIDLLTGDATHEDVLDLCNIPHASAMVALTNNDTGNLEIALGARALRPDVPLVVRMESQTFSAATAELFDIATFSPAELTAPALAALARFPGTLGRVAYGGRDHALVQRTIGADGAGDLTGADPLCVWRRDALTMVRAGDPLRRGDIALYAMERRATMPVAPPALDLSV